MGSANIYYEDKLLPDADYIFGILVSFRLSGIPVLEGNSKDMIMPGSVFVSEHFARETFEMKALLVKCFLLKNKTH